MENNKIRVRFAPSPTGYLHIGSLRTTLYNFLFAQKYQGDFILKIEDTDRKRYIEGAIENLIKSLDWAGLKWNEGVFLQEDVKNENAIQSKCYPNISEVGKYGPYIQSEKLELYKQKVHELVKNGYAYYCFCGPERLDQVRKDQIVMKKAPMYDRHCLQSVNEEKVNENLKNNYSYTVRLKVPKDEIIEFNDIVHGKVTFNTNLVDDQVLLKSDGFPTYHLANVVDDHDMRITHVIRGDEWLPSVPKHLLLYRYFGWQIPKFIHLPLLLNPDRTKLSKRQGDVSVEDYIRKGYLKEAIINFVALLGWNEGKGSVQEIYSLEELIQKFDLSHVHKAGAVFDLKKLDWINSQYIKKLSIDELYQKSLEFFKQKDFYNEASEDRKAEEYLKKILLVEKDRLNKLSEAGESNKFLFQDIQYDKEILRWKEMSDDGLIKSLNDSKIVLAAIEENDWSKENLEKALLEKAGDKRGELLWPLRVALTGEKKSPSPFEVAWILGKKESLARIGQAINILSD